MRQPIVKEYDPTRGVSISTLAREYPRGSRVPQHAHGSDQLIYASRGIMQVTSDHRLWVIPPHFGLWIPARTAHQISMPEYVSVRTLYLRPSLVNLGTTCSVLHIGSFLRELIVEIVRVGKLRARNYLECALRDLFIDQLRRASSVPTGVAVPRDDRALAVAQGVIENPALRSSLASMCAAGGVSVRTLQRAFQRDVGMDFESWRRQVRLMKAVELLVAGRSVKEISFSVGYQGPSAFVTLFRKTFGSTPKAWISALERL
jgi:AraC-like DNA-binding protein